MDRAAGTRLLDRAAEVGLLTAYGGGYYSIHPALPWFFKKMFDEYYADSAARAERAFVEAVAELGNYYATLYFNGAGNVIGILGAEEANLLHARHLARSAGWSNALIESMQGLYTLYDHTGRSAEWARLVEEIVPDFVDSTHGGALPGREEQWSLVTGYRVRLAQDARQWVEAERMQTHRVEWNSQRAAEALAHTPEELDREQRHRIRNLSVSIGELGHIQQERGLPECAQSYSQSYDLALRIQDKPLAAVAAFNLGHAYKVLPALRDLDQAERWYRRDLELEAEGDEIGRAKCLMQLGSVDLQRFLDAREASIPTAELTAYLSKALQFYQQALGLLPSTAINDLATAHNQVGVIYKNAGDLERALDHYRKSISYKESARDLYGAAQFRYNLALALVAGGRLSDAKEYALAALRNYQTYGAGAAREVQQTLKLIALIEEAIKTESGDENE